MPGTMPPGSSGMAPPMTASSGAPAAQPAEPAAVAKPEAKKPVDDSDDPFGSSQPPSDGKKTVTGALSNALMKAFTAPPPKTEAKTETKAEPTTEAPKQ